MNRQLTTTIGHRVVQAEGTRAKHKHGHFVTLAVIAAIGIAAGSILMLTINGNGSGETEAFVVEKRHVMSSIAGRIAAYPLPEKPGSAIEADIGAKKKPRLADTTIVTSSTDSRQTSSPYLLSRQPASERFGGAISVGGAGNNPTQAETVSNSESGLDALNGGSGASSQVPVDVAETESAALEIERKLAALGSEHFEPAAGPAIPVPAAEANVRLWKGRAKKFVNLRAGPDNNAPVLKIVPPNALVLAQKNCVHWCRAVYKGRKGYIYRAFIRRPRQVAKTAQASASKSVETVSQKRLGEIGR